MLRGKRGKKNSKGWPILDSTSTEVPPFLALAVEHLMQHGLDVEGIFRISALLNDVEKLTKQWKRGKAVLLGDVHTVAGGLKLFFREMDDPLLTFELYDAFLEASRQEDESVKVTYLQQAISLLPPLNRVMLKLLLGLLCKMSEHSAKNKMTAANLAIVFAPSIIRAEHESQMEALTNMRATTDLTEYLIGNFGSKLFVDMSRGGAVAPPPVASSLSLPVVETEEEAAFTRHLRRGTIRLATRTILSKLAEDEEGDGPDEAPGATESGAATAVAKPLEPPASLADPGQAPGLVEPPRHLMMAGAVKMPMFTPGSQPVLKKRVPPPSAPLSEGVTEGEGDAGATLVTPVIPVSATSPSAGVTAPQAPPPIKADGASGGPGKAGKGPKVLPKKGGSVKGKNGGPPPKGAPKKAAGGVVLFKPEPVELVPPELPELPPPLSAPEDENAEEEQGGEAEAPVIESLPADAKAANVASAPPGPESESESAAKAKAMPGAVKMPALTKIPLKKGAPPKAPAAGGGSSGGAVSPRPQSPGRDLPPGPGLNRTVTDGPERSKAEVPVLLRSQTDEQSSHRLSQTVGRKSPRPVGLDGGASAPVAGESLTLGRKSPRPSNEDEPLVVVGGGRGRGRGRPVSSEMARVSAEAGSTGLGGEGDVPAAGGGRGKGRGSLPATTSQPSLAMKPVDRSAPVISQVSPVKPEHPGTIRHSTTSIDARREVAAKLGNIFGNSSDVNTTATPNQKTVQELLTMMASGRTSDVTDYLNSLSKTERDEARSQLKALMESAFL